jgi:hypothetical protein
MLQLRLLLIHVRIFLLSPSSKPAPRQRQNLLQVSSTSAESSVANKYGVLQEWLDT